MGMASNKARVSPVPLFKFMRERYIHVLGKLVSLGLIGLDARGKQGNSGEEWVIH